MANKLRVYWPGDQPPSCRLLLLPSFLVAVQCFPPAPTSPERPAHSAPAPVSERSLLVARGQCNNRDLTRGHCTVLGPARILGGKTIHQVVTFAIDDDDCRDGREAVVIATVYSHFPTREDLLAHLIAERMTRLTDLGQRLLNREDAAAALFEWLEVFGADAATYQGLPDSVIRTLHNPQSPLFNSCETMRRTCGALLERAQGAQQVRTDTTATGVLAMTAALYGAAAAGDHDTGQFLAVLFDGLRKRP